MATRAPTARAVIDREHRFFFIMACLMALVLVAGFSTSIALHRSSFHSPLIFHLHGLTFFGWVALYLLQTGLVTTGSTALHKRLGWLALGWVPAMVILGITITVFVIRTDGGPFFFGKNEFLFGNPVGILTFAGLVFWAIGLRRRTDWHRRLMLCAMASLTGPGFGRLLPMPLMMPYAWVSAALIFPALFVIAGMIVDKKRIGHVHPAYVRGLTLLIVSILGAELIAFSPVGYAVTEAVTAGTPGAARVMQAAWPTQP